MFISLDLNNESYAVDLKINFADKEYLIFAKSNKYNLFLWLRKHPGFQAFITYIQKRITVLKNESFAYPVNGPLPTEGVLLLLLLSCCACRCSPRCCWGQGLLCCWCWGRGRSLLRCWACRCSCRWCWGRGLHRCCRCCCWGLGLLRRGWIEGVLLTRCYCCCCCWRQPLPSGLLWQPQRTGLLIWKVKTNVMIMKVKG